MTSKATVFIIDDDPAVRASLSMLLEQEGIKVEAFASAERFLAESRLVAHSCAIVDIRMPEMDGMQLQAELASRGCALPLIFLTGHGNIPMSVRAIKAGAVDFLTKPITRAGLMLSIEAALIESDRLNKQAEANHKACLCVESLTEREREVMVLASEALSNKEIARLLGISHRTVEIHKARIMEKTGAQTLLDLARLAKSSGLLD